MSRRVNIVDWALDMSVDIADIADIATATIADIAGTATALVLQVLGVIQPNLLAAYSSNLFGICCVALIKIRHVRPYKRRLILDGQPAAKAAPVAHQTGHHRGGDRFRERR